MNYLMSYLTFGIVIFGLAWGSFSERCGTAQEFDQVKAMSFMATWPAMLVGVAIFDFTTTPGVCKEGGTGL